MWGDHYKDILNCVSDHVSENALRGEMSNVTLQAFRNADHGELKGVLQGLSNSEALGVDGLSSGAFKYAPSSLITWLCLFINACICHQYIPSQVLAVLLVPLLKSKVKNRLLLATISPLL